MNGELYRWLEAIQDRREYVLEQLASATPVFAVSRPEGILLFGVGLGQSKVFEVYDRHALAALGHPVDIERFRQTAIEAAHLEGFTRSAEDVTLRRLIHFALSPALKNSIERVFDPPMIVEAILTELGPSPEEDAIFVLSFDGNFQRVPDGIAVLAVNKEAAAEAKKWLAKHITKTTNPKKTRAALSTAWNALTQSLPLGPDTKLIEEPELQDGRRVEWAWLDRKTESRAKYRES